MAGRIALAAIAGGHGVRGEEQPQPEQRRRRRNPLRDLIGQ